MTTRHWIAVALVVLAGCKHDARPSPAGGAARTSTTIVIAAPTPVGMLRVPQTHETFKLDGEMSEPPWNRVAGRTRGFIDPASGGEARPYSEGRFLWDAENLYVALYAADDDIRATVTDHDGPVWIDDAFSLLITPATPPGAPTYSFDISASGVVTDVKRVAGAKDDPSWESGIKLGVDRDGTLNDPKDMDEEWVVEAAIPLNSMGLEAKPGTRLLVRIARCDTPRNTKEKRCSSWGTEKAPRLLELGP